MPAFSFYDRRHRLSGMRDTNESEKQRLFFALWPPRSMQERFYVSGQSVNGGRSVPLQNLHVTLAFLGSVTREQRVCVERCAGLVRASSFELTFDRLDCFRKRGLFWIGPSQVPAAMHALAGAIARVQAACAPVPEQREYRPHITLVRDLIRCPPPCTVDPVAWPVHEFSLVRSITAPGGSHYEILGSWTLR